jgi:hypothetical protein
VNDVIEEVARVTELITPELIVLAIINVVLTPAPKFRAWDLILFIIVVRAPTEETSDVVLTYPPDKLLPRFDMGPAFAVIQSKFPRCAITSYRVVELINPYSPDKLFIWLSKYCVLLRYPEVPSPAIVLTIMGSVSCVAIFAIVLTPACTVSRISNTEEFTEEMKIILKKVSGSYHTSCP